LRKDNIMNERKRWGGRMVICFCLVFLVSSALVGCGPSVSQICIWQEAGAVEPLIAALKDKKPVIQWKAAEALGDIRDSRAVEPLIDTLKDESIPVRKSVVEALGKIGDIRAVEPLIDVLKDNYPSVRKAAVEALRKIVDVKEIIGPLENLAQNDPNSDVRQAAKETLEKTTDAPQKKQEESVHPGAPEFLDESIPGWFPDLGTVIPADPEH
jgi:HEAT repeat protein